MDVRADRAVSYVHLVGNFFNSLTLGKSNRYIKLSVRKLSDSPGKAMCRDDDYLDYLQRSVAFRLGREKN